jgi:hypothetical protein
MTAMEEDHGVADEPESAQREHHSPPWVFEEFDGEIPAWAHDPHEQGGAGRNPGIQASR